MGNTVCTLAPKITRVQVDYTSAGINTTQLDAGIADVGGTAGLSAVTTIYYMQLFAQAIFTNIVGDELQQAILDVDAEFHNETILFGMVNCLHIFPSFTHLCAGTVSTWRRRVQRICKKSQILHSQMLFTNCNSGSSGLSLPQERNLY